MASLSNINGIFDVHSTGAILFSTSHGTSGQILKSNGNAAPTWVAASTVIGGPYVPIAGDVTINGYITLAAGKILTVGGNLFVTGTSTFNGDMTLPAAADHFLIGAGSLQTTGRIKFGLPSWNNSIGLESYWMVMRSNSNEGYKFIDSGGNTYAQFNASTNSAGAYKATFAGIVQVDGSNLGIGGAPANASYGSIGTKLDMKGGADSIIILRGAAGGTGAGAYIASEYGLYSYNGEFMLTRTNESSWWSSPDFKLSGGNATFAGDARFNSRVRIGDVTGLSNRGTVRIDTRGDVPADLLFGRDTAGTATSWDNVYWSLSSRGSSEGNNFKLYRGSAHDSPYNSEAVPFQISPDLNATFAGNVTINGTLTIGGNSPITRSGSTAQGRLAIWQNDTAIKGDSNLSYASQYLTVGVGTAGGFAAIRINAATTAQTYLDFTEGATFTKRAQIQVDTNDNMYFRNTSSNTLRMTISSDGTLTSSSSAGSYGIRQNGVSNISNSGYIAGTGTLSFNYDCDSQGSMFIECVFNHYGFISSYGCARIATVANGPNIQVNDIQNISSGNGGSWTFTRVSNTRFTIAKTAGTYGGGGHYFVNIRGNGVKYI